MKISDLSESQIAGVQAAIDKLVLADGEILPTVDEYALARANELFDGYAKQSTQDRVRPAVEKLEKLNPTDLADVLALIDAKPVEAVAALK